MAPSNQLAATERSEIGKTSRKLATEGKIPAVLYGPGRAPVSLALDRHDFELFASHHASSSTVVELKIEGSDKVINAMIREVQHSAVMGTILHVDFIEISLDKLVHAAITIHLLNDPAGVRAGGVLTSSMHELNVEAKPNDLPDSIEVDVSALEIGDSLHAGQVELPARVTLLDDPEAVIASVQAPRAEVEEVPVEAEEGAEPEVIGAEESEE
jgi:large subunit ribosomal protein L25